MKPQLVLSVLALTLAIGHCRGPWNLSDPVMQIANNRVSVTLEGPKKLKAVSFFMSIDKSFENFKDAEHKFKLVCKRVSKRKSCSGTGGPALAAGQTVHYAVKAKLGRKRQNLLGKTWTPVWATSNAPGGPTPNCASLEGDLPNGCIEVGFIEPAPIIPGGNPERGFYKHTESKTSSWSPVDDGQLREWAQSGYSLIYRNIILDSFVDSDISTEILQKIRDDFTTIKANRMKVILRFSYSIDINNKNDAPPEQLLMHITQLAPILKDNAALIAVMHAGFIGVWGEWYYTAHYGNEGVLSEEDWARRRQVVSELLQALPVSREIQLRTPEYKRRILDRTSALTEDEAFGEEQVARIGHHNDCFLASDTDFGTFTNKTDEYPYVQQETQYVTMGGESCNLNPPRSDCPTALKELEELHYTYLNADYHPDVLDAWNSQDCFDEVYSSLGYRLVGVMARIPEKASLGSTVYVGVRVQNMGWAAPINYRRAEILLLHETSGEKLHLGVTV
ncbi:uncharacterized protein LOC119574502 isoform X2 [Penaeus monodon]|uniref:uncharacterized protein LOC119574502 isoform X2 n=1 Tax=Penaeus monodon TaxID=6687 RepID=UPI0018A6EB0F|nr:uncharacterized protein LOC119574502 isoform X2 [Penaeus monodon]